MCCCLKKTCNSAIAKFSTMSFQKTVLVLAGFLCLVTPSLTKDFQLRDLDKILNALDDSNIDAQSGSSSEPVALRWGIGDSVAVVGRLFKYKLPDDAFKGKINNYKVMEAGKDALPSWLLFHDKKAELMGVPSPKESGQIYLEVIATGEDNSIAKDVFSVTVKEDVNSGDVGSVVRQPGENTPKTVRCKQEEPQTVVTLIVDTDMDLLGANHRLAFMNNVVKHLNLSTDMVKVEPVGNKPMFDSSALVAGPGDSKNPVFPGCLVSWLVGCGKVESDHMPILQRLESSAVKGDMAKAIGHPIIGWHVTNTRFQVKPRKKRAVLQTATATMTMPPPSTLPSETIKVTKTGEVMTHTIPSPSIAPTKSVEVQPTAVVSSPVMTTSVTTSSVMASESVKMPMTSSTPTEILPTKTYTMTSKSLSETKPMPTKTVPTTMSTAKTPEPTPEPTTRKISTRKPTTTTIPPTPKPRCPKRGPKLPPIVSHPIGSQPFKAGNIIRYKIKKDTFFDCYHEDIRELNLQITRMDTETGAWVPLDSDFWLILRDNTLKGMPLSQDADIYTFNLTATNKYGKSAYDIFTFDIMSDEDTGSGPNHELSMTIDMDYNDFMSNLDNRIQFTNKLAALYGDKNAKSIKTTRIDPGSVVYGWSNNSLPTDKCDVKSIYNMVNRLIAEDGSLSQEAVKLMEPYKLTDAAAVPMGSCEGHASFPQRSTKTTTTKKPLEPSTKRPFIDVDYDDDDDDDDDDDPQPDEPTSTTKKTEVAAAGAGGGGDSDIWITTVVPAIVVVIILVIALIVACILYKKKRKGKMKLEEQNSFNNKGVPVIFADELDEKPNDSTKPLIMEEERPPMPPPEYQRASSESSHSTQPIDDRNTMGEDIEMDDTDVTSPLYQPPPPVTASSNNKPPPPHLQASRNPPPYVPP